MRGVSLRTLVTVLGHSSERCRLDLTEPVVILHTNAKVEEELCRDHLRPLSVQSYAALPGGEAGRVYFRGDLTISREDQLTRECLDYIVDALCKCSGNTPSAIMTYLFAKSNPANQARFSLVIQIQGWKKVPVVPISMREMYSCCFCF